MSINASGWRPEIGSGEAGEATTFTGNRALMLEEALIFEREDFGGTGVELPPAPKAASRLGGLERNRPIGLPGLSEPVWLPIPRARAPSIVPWRRTWSGW